MPADLLGALSGARSVFVLSGAGMSAESGIPTFRDAQTGLWAKFRPEELATPEAFAENPGRVWSWYEDRRQNISEASPHKGHFSLAELEHRVPEVTIATQNVDGLHQAAGSTRVLELHGNIMQSICHRTRRPIDPGWLAMHEDSPPASPHHPQGLARPAVVWFGEALPMAPYEAAMEAASRCDFCFSVGTTSMVQPAASLPLLALDRGIPLVEINPNETPLSMHASHCLRGSAGAVLPVLLEQLQS